MSVIQLTKDNFKEQALNSGKITLVDFYADWCGPCKMMAPIVAEIAEENQQFNIGKVNTDEQPELSGKYSIYSIPTLLIFKDGQIVDQQVGTCSKEELLQKLNQA